MFLDKIDLLILTAGFGFAGFIVYSEVTDFNQSKSHYERTGHYLSHHDQPNYDDSKEKLWTDTDGCQYNVSYEKRFSLGTRSNPSTMVTKERMTPHYGSDGKQIGCGSSDATANTIKGNK